jgi:dTDP-4-dehydrorhamnose 3,5-epimerase
MSEFYQADAAAGIRWDDPKIAIKWPISNPILSPRDRALPLFDQVFL